MNDSRGLEPVTKPPVTVPILRSPRKIRDRPLLPGGSPKFADSEKRDSHRRLSDSRLIRLALLLVAVGGCRKSQPTLTGGQELGYWINATRDVDPRMRKEAVFKLGNAGPIDPSVLSTLTAKLQDPSPPVRCETILAIVKCCPLAGDPVVGELEKLAKFDADAKVRDYAWRAKEKLCSPQ